METSLALAHLPRSLRPVLLTSGFAVALLAARVLMTGQGTYSFLAWNLFLAWVPLGCAAVTEAGGRHGGRRLLPAVQQQ